MPERSTSREGVVLRAPVDALALSALLCAGLLCAGLMGAGLLGAGCTPTPTQILVTIDSDLEPEREVAVIELTVRDPRSILARTTLLRIDCASDGFGRLDRDTQHIALPFSFAVRPPAGEAGRQVQIEARALDAEGTLRATAIRRVGFVEGQQRHLPIALEASCRDRLCGDETVRALALTRIEREGEEMEGLTPRSCGLLDGGLPDGEVRDGSVTLPARPIFPWNGYATGSARVPATSSVADPPRRPKLRWEATAGALEYELELDDTCPIEGYRLCAFPSPEISVRTPETSYRPEEPLAISSSAPVGRRYFWRLRACDALECGPWSEVRYLDVGRQRGDYNGDGYADLAVGAPNADGTMADEGGVELFLGTAGPLVRAGALGHPAGQTGSGFGSRLAELGDLNGDGFSDLAVAAPSQSVTERAEGVVLIYLGSEAGLPAAPSITLDSPSGMEGSGFGAVLAGAGDLDGDGYADLVTSSPDLGAAEGEVYLYFGALGGLRSRTPVTLVSPSPEERGRFGADLAGGADVDGDGYVDLVIGAEGESDPEMGEGVIYLYAGGLEGVSERPTLALDNPDDQAAAHFGTSVAFVGDVDGDGFADLLVGASLLDRSATDEGGAFLFLGGPEGLAAEPSLRIPNPSGQEGGQLGAAVAGAGDFNGDGFADLLLGAPFQDLPVPNEGGAFLYQGGPSGPVGIPSRSLRNPDMQSEARFGATLAAPRDIDGDGYSDVVIGAWLQDVNGSDDGAIFVLRGAATFAIPTTVRFERTGTVSNDLFGFGLPR